MMKNVISNNTTARKQLDYQSIEELDCFKDSHERAIA